MGGSRTGSASAATRAAIPQEPPSAQQVGGPLVAVIDSGWGGSRTDPRIVAGVSLLDTRSNPLHARPDIDLVGHGTACSWLILCTAPHAMVTPVRVFGERLQTSPEVLCSAIEISVDLGARVINLSLGTTEAGARDRLYRTCRAAADAGVIIVAASGQSGAGLPAAFDCAIGVAANRFRDPLRFRYIGDRSPADVEAHGSPPPWLAARGGAAKKAASSFATPRISGLIASIVAREPTITLDDARAILVRDSLVARDPAAAISPREYGGPC